MKPAGEALWIFLVLAICSMSGVIFTGLTAAEKQRQSIQRHAIDAARAASLVLNSASHAELAAKKEMWSEDHKAALRPLVILHRNHPEIARIRTFARDGNQIVIVLDTETVAADARITRPVDPQAIGTTIPESDPLYDSVDSALKAGSPNAADQNDERPYGTYLPAVLPVDSTFAVEALLDVGELNGAVDGTLQAMFLGATLSFVASIAVALIFFNFRTAHMLAESVGGEAKRGNEWLQERNRRLVDALGQIALHRMVDSGILLWSGDTDAMLGRPADAMPTRYNDWLPIIHNLDRSAIEDALASATPLVPAFEAEYRVDVPGKGLRWFRERGIVEFAAEGNKAISADSILLDIHDRRSAEENRQALALVVSRTDNAVALTDPTGIIRWVNPAFESLTKFSPDEATGKNLATLIGTTPLIDPDLPGAAASQRELRRRDGSPYWADIEVVALGGDDSKPLQFVVIQRDISDAKAFEAELVSAKDKALEADRAKSEFLAVMSHEIRTPLNAVIGFTNLLLKTELGEQQRDYIETIKNSGDNLLLLLNDILNFSKTDAAEIAIESVPFDPAKLVEDAMDSFGAAANEKGLELISTATLGSIGVAGDESRIRQILVNLIGNAVKFTDQGEVVVDIGQSPGSDGTSETLRFEIRDTGQGIDPTHQGHLFQPFSQADSSATRRHGGTGLGLAICKKLCDLLGGKIGSESKPGRGSTFWVELPVKAARAPGDPHRFNEIFSGLRALVAVRNANLLESLSSRLRNWGVQVEVCHRGRDVIYEATARRFDFLVLDEALPDVDPEYLVERLRRTSRGSAAAIVLLATEPEADANPSIPFAQIVHKPVLSENFVSAVAAAAARSLHDAPQHKSTPWPAPTSPKPRRERAETQTKTQTKTKTQTQPKPQTQPQPQQESPATAQSTILVAEDNPINRKLINKMLVGLGCVPDLVTNGVECVEAAQKKPYDLILMDLQMPEMDGLEATRKLRELHITIPIIAVTADAMDVDRDRCIAAGMTDYLSKPIRSEALSRVLQKHT